MKCLFDDREARWKAAWGDRDLTVQAGFLCDNCLAHTEKYWKTPGGILFRDENGDIHRVDEFMAEPLGNLPGNGKSICRRMLGSGVSKASPSERSRLLGGILSSAGWA